MENPPHDPWWKSAVVYQIYPRSFCDSNGDGVGDLRGITSRLDHVASLGVDVIWLSPIYRSPMDDNGYDIADYEAVDPLFGTMDDFAELVDAVHARGMKLVMDLVVNHTSDEHPWFVDSRDPASPKRDWYYWRAARPGFEAGAPGAEPTNAGSVWGGSAWELDPTSGEYYLHLFGRKQPDLNWENPEVRAEVYAMMNRWVDRGVDGFRMDVINLITKPLELVDGRVTPGMPFSADIELITRNHDRFIAFVEEMNREVGITERQLFTVGEMIGCTVDMARQYTSQFHPRLGMVFTFEHMLLDRDPLNKFTVRPLHLPDLKKNLARWQEGLAEEGWNSLYWCNHDQPRVVSRFGDDSPRHRVASAKAWATVLHGHCGTPYVYQGEELGMTNAGFDSIEQYLDIETIGLYAEAKALGVSDDILVPGMAMHSRDNARTPMPWDAHAPSHGFTTGVPWLPLNTNSDHINAATAQAETDGVLQHYRRLVELRHESEVLRHGRYALLLPDDDRLWVFTRTLGERRLLVVANMSSEAASLPMSELPSLEGARPLLDTAPASGDPQTLAPWAAQIYELA